MEGYQPYDWVCEDFNGKATVRIWTHNRNSERVLLRVEDYQPYLRIELPSIHGGKPLIWSANDLRTYSDHLAKILKGKAPVKRLFSPLKKLYLFRRDNVFPILYL